MRTTRPLPARRAPHPAPGGWRRRLPALAAAAALACVGCVGYRLGSTLPPDIRTVHVPAFVNRTGEPLLESDTTRAVIAELQRDGTLRVADADTADATLQVTLTEFRLEPLRYDRNNARLTNEYRMRIRAEIVFSRRQTGRELLRRTVEGEQTFTPGGDLTSSKRTALPGAARDLAHEVVESVVEYW